MTEIDTTHVDRVEEFMARKRAEGLKPWHRRFASIKKRSNADALTAWRQYQEFMSDRTADRRRLRKREFIAGFEAGRRVI